MLLILPLWPLQLCYSIQHALYLAGKAKAASCITQVPLSQTVATVPYRKVVRLASSQLAGLGNSSVLVRQPECISLDAFYDMPCYSCCGCTNTWRMSSKANHYGWVSQKTPNVYTLQ